VGRVTTRRRWTHSAVNLRTDFSPASVVTAYRVVWYCYTSHDMVIHGIDAQREQSGSNFDCLTVVYAIDFFHTLQSLFILCLSSYSEQYVSIMAPSGKSDESFFSKARRVLFGGDDMPTKPKSPRTGCDYDLYNDLNKAKSPEDIAKATQKHTECTSECVKKQTLVRRWFIVGTREVSIGQEETTTISGSSSK
jgi:hypothetical protein